MVDPRTLASVDSLTVLSEGGRRQLAQHLDAVRFMPGDVLIHEGRRWVDAANTLRLPSWTRTDLSLRHTQGLGSGQAVTWRLGVRNLFDVQAWREASTSGGHIYLFPLAARTVTASAQLDF